MRPAQLIFLASSLAAVCIGCVKPVPTPVPGPTPVSPDSGPRDAFYGVTGDCTLPVVAAQRAGVVDNARTCLDVGNTADCFVELSKMAEKDTIICVVQQLDMGLHQSMAKGTANDTMIAEAAAADNWIKTEQIGIRN